MITAVPQVSADPAPARTGVRRLLPRTVPGRIRAFTAAGLVAVLALFVVAALAAGHARDGVKTMGHDAGPQVVATGNLFFALSDMDAQVANLLLTGYDPSLKANRAAALARYGERRAEADRALVQAAQLAGDDPAQRETAQSVLEGLGRYEQLVGRAITLDEQSRHAAGPPPGPVIALHRQATDLMKLELLPKAYNLTLESGTVVRKSYEKERSAVQEGGTWVGFVAMVVLAVLVGGQIYLAGRFRRRFNLPLVLATVGVVVLTLASTQMLAGQADRLKTAKTQGFDSLLTLSRARAITNSAFGDESRFLLDPERADIYEQVYLDKMQSIIYIPVGNLGDYQDEQAPFDVTRPALGLFGDEARRSGPSSSDAFGDVLEKFTATQLDDAKMRALVADGKSGQAVREHLAITSGRGSHFQYDQAFTTLIDDHRRSFDRTIKSADDRLNPWDVLLPVSAVALAALILIGVRPRLAEYR